MIKVKQFINDISRRSLCIYSRIILVKTTNLDDFVESSSVKDRLRYDKL